VEGDTPVRKSNLSKDKTKRAPRGRSQFTKVALSRAIDVARAKGIDRVEVELPGQSRIVLNDNPYSDPKQGVAAQAWDRGSEYAMRVVRYSNS
jgi:hypothetical protein